MERLRRILTLVLIAIMIYKYANAQLVNEVKGLSPWEPGILDIHHINTGRGNATYFIFPDGTTMLLDAGELSPLDKRIFSERNTQIRPDSSLKPFEWIVRYIQRMGPRGHADSIDYGIVTHFHDDHFGAWYPGAPASSTGKFILSGITGVGENLPIMNLLDRCTEYYNYPFDMSKDAGKYGGGEIEFENTMKNYLAFIDEKRQEGMSRQVFKAGSLSQVVMKNDPSSYKGFFVRNIKSGPFIWSGVDSTAYNHFPAYSPSDITTWPDENSLSLALVVHYGNFSYYTGGDNPGNVFPGDKKRDVETPIATAVGEVDIATMDHHGNRDAVNEFMVKTMRPRVWIGQTWSADHPGHEVLVRATSQYLYPGERDMFSTGMLEANRLVIGPLIDRSYKSQQGHIVVRVAPGGETYQIIILDDGKADLPVKAVFGPYKSKIKQ